tara:strand:- start:26118 stop:26261 length:144 start_codon:yes stop_codon:yes gene_type:complete
MKYYKEEVAAILLGVVSFSILFFGFIFYVFDDASINNTNNVILNKDK